jgi:ABC-type nitrate/sulfonate/bicarbonate transport system permease component
VTAVSEQPTSVPEAVLTVAPPGPRTTDPLWRKLLAPLGMAVLSLVVICALWVGFLKLTHVNSLVAKTPLDVAKFFWNGEANGQKASDVWSQLGRTLWDAGLGLVFGMAAAILAALTFMVSRIIERTFLPLALIVATIPLVAMTPIITLVFGRGVVGVTVISALVVFFPALITVSYGLRTTSKQASELCRVYGAGSVTVARKVMIPSAMPAIFAATRIAVPGAIVGAMLAEYLASGKGLGYGILQAATLASYDTVWAATALITFVSVLVYYLVAAVEQVVLTRFGSPAARR